MGEFVAKKVEPAKPAKPKLNYCEFVGEIQKGSRFGNFTFKADEKTKHQKHGVDFTCLDVVTMETNSGRHAEDCIHVGYWTAKACGCNK